MSQEPPKMRAVSLPGPQAPAGPNVGLPDRIDDEAYAQISGLLLRLKRAEAEIAQAQGRHQIAQGESHAAVWDVALRYRCQPHHIDTATGRIDRTKPEPAPPAR